jgi:hypothetical protein
MTFHIGKFAHGILLGVILLLAAGTNPTSLSIDNDGDDATPPITVELNFALPCVKAINLHQTPLVNLATAVAYETHEPMADITHYGVRMLNVVSPPLVAPLIVSLRT